MDRFVAAAQDLVRKMNTQAGGSGSRNDLPSENS
jgi:hypothetical protein